MRIVFIFLLFFYLININAKEWTLMVYINGDNNLDEYAFKDFNELESFGSNDDINIVVQYDRYEANSQADWSTAKRFYITKDLNPEIISSEEKADLGEINSGDYTNVVDFVNWAKTNYPAQKYALIIWDHGSGWQKKNVFSGTLKVISVDDTDSGQISIANGDFKRMLEEIKGILGKKLDFLGLDACLMGMWEVAFSSDEYSEYLAFSEETENATGWDYKKLLTEFFQTDKTARSLCKTVVTTSLESVGATLSCIDLGYIPSLTEKLNNFANHFLTDYSIDLEILTAYSYTMGMETEPNYKDLGMFFNNLIPNVPDEIKITYLAPIINEYYNAVVISEGIDTEVARYSKTTGMTIYMGYGNNFGNDNDSRTYSESEWGRETSWDDFIKREFRLAEDGYEPDNTFDTAYFNENLATTSHSIHINEDTDFMKLNLKENHFYNFKTACGNYDTYMVLYDENGTQIDENDDKDGRCAAITYFASSNETVFIEVYSYAHDSVALYDLIIDENEKQDDYPNKIENVEDDDLLTDGLEGMINYPGDTDVFFIDSHPFTEYSIETSDMGLDDTVLSVYDESGNLIVENDDIDTNGRNYLSKVKFEADYNGRYYVFIRAYEDKTGGYKIKFSSNTLCVPTNGGIEICDGLDNDCDGIIDNNLTPPPADLQEGVCAGSKKICGGQAGWVEPDYRLIKNYEKIEKSCDGFDNDCNGSIDDISSPPLNINQKGVCKGSRQVCKNGVWTENYEDIEDYSVKDDNNDGLDNNCDGQIDESYKEASCSFQGKSGSHLFLFFVLFLISLELKYRFKK